jgi:hypothetical protein
MNWITSPYKTTSSHQLDSFVGLTHPGLKTWYGAQESYLKDIVTNSATDVTNQN